MANVKTRRPYFDPEKPITLLRWGPVREVTAEESARLRADGALWMGLAYGPYDKTVHGGKDVEVRNTKPWLKDWQPGRVAVVSRAYRMPHFAAAILVRADYPDLASARRDPVGAALLARAKLEELSTA